MTTRGKAAPRRRPRSADAVARGDALVAEARALTRTGARAACERLRASVANCAWDRLHPGLAVSISIGLADALAHATGAATLAAADARLYEAKRAGRNRVR